MSAAEGSGRKQAHSGASRFFAQGWRLENGGILGSLRMTAATPGFTRSLAEKVLAEL